MALEKLTFSFHKPRGSAGCRVALDLILLQTSTCPEHSLQERFSRYSEGCPLSPPGGLCDKFSWKYLCLGVGSRYPLSDGPPNWGIHSCLLISTRGPPKPLLKAIDAPVFLPGESRGAWWATVHGFTKSWTWLSMHSCKGRLYSIMTWCLYKKGEIWAQTRAEGS